MNLPPGVRSEIAKTDRLRMRYIESGPRRGKGEVMGATTWSINQLSSARTL
jgi:hypothetical protein